jgi:hypothetical protein
MFLRLLPALVVVAVCLLVAPGPRPTAALSTISPDQPPRAAGERPSAEEFDRLARTDPAAMLAACEDRCRADLQRYQAVLTKQERIGGKLLPVETIRVTCRQEPFAVRMIWDAGARTDGVLGFAIRALRYLPGDAKPMVVYRPKALFTEQAIDPRGADARKAARFGIEESGLAQAVRRTREAWSALKRRGELDVEYLGVRSHPDLGDRPCHVLRRTCRTPEIDPFVRGETATVTDANRADAFDAVTIWIDGETWLQLGTEQTRNGEIMARYFFRLTEVNPPFGKDEFDTTALRK